MNATDPGAGETKKATVNGLAVIGFIGIVIAGMLLAVYASRYVPQLLGNLSSAVYLTSDKPQNGSAQGANANTSANGGTNGTASAPTFSPTAPIVPSYPVAPTSTPAGTSKPSTAGAANGGTTYHYTQPSGPRLYGYPDLALTDVRVGYYSGSALIEDDRIPRGDDMGVGFVVRNLGTNVVSNFYVRVRIEGEPDAIAVGGLLYPNGYQAFTLRANDLPDGTDSVRIDVDYPNAVYETNEANNSYATEVDVDGSSSSSRNVSCDIWASDTSVSDGDRITLSWDTDGNPDTARINNGIGDVDENGGSERVTVDGDTTYRLTVENQYDTDTCEVKVYAD